MTPEDLVGKLHRPLYTYILASMTAIDLAVIIIKAMFAEILISQCVLQINKSKNETLITYDSTSVLLSIKTGNYWKRTIRNQLNECCESGFSDITLD